MIVIRFCGGLGNQLFQYALYDSFARNDIDVQADISDYLAKNYHQGFELEKVFKNLELRKIKKKEIFKITGRLPVFYGGPGKEKIRKLRKILNRKLFYKRNGNVIFGSEYVSTRNSKEMQQKLQIVDKTWYIDKFYPTVNDFDDIKSTADLLCFIPFTEEENISLANRIKNAETSVSVHIRRGDYVGTGFDVLNEKYYINAVKYIQNKVKNPFFYFFSDDTEYVAEKYGWLQNKIIVQNNKKEKSFRDMQLMSLCQYNIIANSTFSLWAALLNKNKNKEVLCPLIFNTNDEDVKYGLEEWTGISNS